MSKASAWAKKRRAVERVRPKQFRIAGLGVIAYVHKRGRFAFGDTLDADDLLTPREALALASWIQDTFGKDRGHA